MNCNCNNINNNDVQSAGTVRIKHVFGNVLRLAIPLDIIILTQENGVVSQTQQSFYPNTSYPVIVVLRKGNIRYEYTASVNGNVVSIEDTGTIAVGIYQVEVLCKNDAGEPMRYMVRAVVQIVDATVEAGIEAGVEFDAESYTLDGGVFLYAKGEDGVGISEITETAAEGGHLITVTLTDGRETTFTVLDGEGTLPSDIVRDADYTHTDNNFTDEEKEKLGVLENYDDTSLSQRVSGIESGTSGLSNRISALEGSSVTHWVGTMSQYEAIAEKDENTLYFIYEEND